MAKPVYDSSSKGSFGTSPSWSHTTSGSNRILIVFVGGASDPGVSGITYNSVAMTKFAETTYPGSGYAGFSGWYLINPASGTNTIAVTSSGNCTAIASSFTGAKQSGQPDSFGVNNNASGTSSLAVSTTVVAADCLLVGGVSEDQGSGATGGTNTTVRDFTGQGLNIADSGTSTIGTGSQALNYTMGGSWLFRGITASIAPVAASGPTSVKTVNGVTAI